MPAQFDQMYLVTASSKRRYSDALCFLSVIDLSHSFRDAMDKVWASNAPEYYTITADFQFSELDCSAEFSVLFAVSNSQTGKYDMHYAKPITVRELNI